MRGLSARNISVEFRHPGGGAIRVLDGVDLTVRPGMIVGLTGVSGQGKTTLGRVMAGLMLPSCGQVICDGMCVGDVRSRSGRTVRGKIGMVFQSPRRSCDPRLTLKQTIQQAAAPGTDLDAVLAAVVLTTDLLERRPAQISEGQLQRAAVARTLAAGPDYLILDEMAAMLDPATTATVMNAVRRFVANGGGALFISHDHELLSVVADEVCNLSGQRILSCEPPHGRAISGTSTPLWSGAGIRFMKPGAMHPKEDI